MNKLSEILSESQALAATTQAKLRNSSHALRHGMTPYPQKSGEQLGGHEDADDAADSIPAPAQLPELVQMSSAHNAITLSPLDLPGQEFRNGLDRRKQNRELLMDWLRTALVEGVDFGKVHVVSKDKCEHARAGRVKGCTNQYHWSKPSLFKPGAEKITGMLGMTVHFPSLQGYEQTCMSGIEIAQIMLRCELHDALGRVVAEGVGARRIAQDYGDVNKSLKMAEKSAHIDATLRLAGLSEVFTQDVEDVPPPERDDLARYSNNKPSAARPVQGDTPASVKPVKSAVPTQNLSHDIEIVSADDVAMILERIAEAGMTEKRVLAWLYKVTKGAVTKLEQLNVTQCSTLLKRLDSWAQEAAATA